MKLTLENIGLIKYAELDLSKDLIVLCGPNNTGKTYAAYCVYGLSLLRNDSLITGKLEPWGAERSGNSLIEQGEINLKDVFDANFDVLSQYIGGRLWMELPRIFGATETRFENSRVTIKLDRNRAWNSIFRSAFQKSFKHKGTTTLNKDSDSEILTIVYSPFGDDTSNPNGTLDLIIHTAIRRQFLKEIVPNLHIEPTERLAVNLFWKEIALNRTFPSDLPDEIQERLIDTIRPFTLAIRDSLEQAARVSEIQNNRGEFEIIAIEIEQQLLGGKLSIGRENEVIFSPIEVEDSILIHQAGSVVKAIASMVFYLRHQAKKGDLYIIDEPELTLHPDNQRKMARFLARMVNAGIKVIMSTHSDYIIRELNNLMMLHTDRNPQKVEELMAKYGYAKDDLLDHNRVGAYMFTKDVAPIEVTEIGFEVDTIDNEINQQNNSSMEIFMDLHE